MSPDPKPENIQAQPPYPVDLVEELEKKLQGISWEATNNFGNHLVWIWPEQIESTVSPQTPFLLPLVTRNLQAGPTPHFAWAAVRSARKDMFPLKFLARL